MALGVLSRTLLLTLGMPPAHVSAAVHAQLIVTTQDRQTTVGPGVLE